MSAAFAESTYICLNNTTSTTKYIAVTDIDNYDWDNDNRPDHNFQAKKILPGEILCNEEDVNYGGILTTVGFDFHITPGEDIRMYYDGKWASHDNTNLVAHGKAALRAFSNPNSTYGSECKDDIHDSCYEFYIMD